MGGNWPVRSLTHLMEIKGGAQPPANTFKEELLPGYIRFVQIRDFETDAHLTFIKDDCKWRKCSETDVLIARYGASVGRVCRGVAGAYNVALVKVIPKNGTNLNYLYYLLRSEFFQLPLSAMSGRSAQAGFNKDDLSVIEVPVPPCDVQAEIAHILGTLDDKIELNRKQNETLEAMVRAIFKAWFVDFEPVRAKMEGRWQRGQSLPGLPADLYDLFPDRLVETGLGEAPEGWGNSNLKDVCTYLNRGISPDYVDQGGVLVLNQKCIRDFAIDFSKARRHDFSRKKIDGRTLLAGDILVNSTGVGTLGRLAQVRRLREETIVDSHITVVRSGLRINPFYLGCFMEMKQPQIEAMGEGSTGQTELARAKLGDMQILLPSTELLDMFALHVRGFSECISQNLDDVSTLTHLRNTLLPKLISGELRVPDAERIAGTAA